MYSAALPPVKGFSLRSPRSFGDFATNVSAGPSPLYCGESAKTHANQPLQGVLKLLNCKFMFGRRAVLQPTEIWWVRPRRTDGKRSTGISRTILRVKSLHVLLFVQPFKMEIGGEPPVEVESSRMYGMYGSSSPTVTGGEACQTLLLWRRGYFSRNARRAKRTKFHQSHQIVLYSTTDDFRNNKLQWGITCNDSVWSNEIPFCWLSRASFSCSSVLYAQGFSFASWRS